VVDVVDEAWEFTITGRVQGVGFRYFTQREALALGLRGWVKNMPDGSVRLQAAGDSASLEALREALRRGPPHGRVDHLDEERLPDHQAEHLTPFEIVY
jgi:acylphosphatase